MVVCLAPLGITSPMVSFPALCGPTSLSLNLSAPNRSLACCGQYSAVLVLPTLNDGFLPHPRVLHFLLKTLTIPPRACCKQYSAVFVPATPNDGTLPQLSVLHFLLETLTIPLGACCAQYSTVFVPATPNDGCLPQPSVLQILL